MARSCAFLLLSLVLAPPVQAQTRPAAKPAPARPAPRRPPAPAPKTAPAPAPAAVVPKPQPPDLHLALVHTTGTTSTLSTVQLKGARTRISVGDNLASIQQCDNRNTLQLNTQARTFLAVPFDDGTAAKGVLEARKKGGSVIYKTTVTDTGETQPMFGFTARHLKTVVTRDATLDACDKRPQQVETDGWYIDLPAALTCATLPAKPVTIEVDPKNGECVDEVTFEAPARATGYPVKYTSVSTIGSDAPVTTTMEVRQAERVELDASLMSVPGDWMEVRTVSQLTADHRPGEPGTKKPGTLRVGLTPLNNRSEAPLETELLNEALFESFGDTDVDYVRLAGGSPAEFEADAKAKDVDLVLTSTISEVKTPRGGIIGKVNGTSGDAFTAKVDYALVPPGQAKARANGSERSGGSTLNSALTLAKKVVQFAPPLMMAKYGYMNAYGSMLSQPGAASGAMKQSPDPVMNMAFSLLDKATAKTAPDQFATREAAVASALEKVLKSVVSDVGKAAQAEAKRGR